MATDQSTTIPHARGTLAPEARTHILGHLIDGIGFIETACAALERDDKTAFAMPCLHQGIGMLRHVHDVLDRADAVSQRNPSRRRAPRKRPKRKRAP